MKQYKVGILGATGSVGREMMKILLERDFPISELHLFASERSAGKVVAWNSKPIQIELAAEDAFEGLDIVLGAAESDVAKQFAPAIVKAGAVFIDNSSAFRLRPDVPLVVPEVNAGDVKQHRGIISNPNCSTIIAVTAVNALRQLSPIVSMTASTYQAVSGAGAAGPVELSEQVNAVMKGQPVQAKVFPHQIAFNLIPQIGSEQENGYTSEEMKLQYEGRKILHLPEMKVSCTCVRVPVVRSHSISLNIKFQRRPSVYEARRAIQFAPGCKLVDDLAEAQYPMPLDTSDQDLVYVGRIRPDLTDEDGLCLWCCGDQIRKGAATNAIQIAELLTDRLPFFCGFDCGPFQAQLLLKPGSAPTDVGVRHHGLQGHRPQAPVPEELKQLPQHLAPEGEHHQHLLPRLQPGQGGGAPGKARQLQQGPQALLPIRIGNLQGPDPGGPEIGPDGRKAARLMHAVEQYRRLQVFRHSQSSF